MTKNHPDEPAQPGQAMDLGFASRPGVECPKCGITNVPEIRYRTRDAYPSAIHYVNGVATPFGPTGDGMLVTCTVCRYETVRPCVDDPAAEQSSSPLPPERFFSWLSWSDSLHRTLVVERVFGDPKQDPKQDPYISFIAPTRVRLDLDQAQSVLDFLRACLAEADRLGLPKVTPVTRCGTCSPAARPPC